MGSPIGGFKGAVLILEAPCHEEKHNKCTIWEIVPHSECVKSERNLLCLDHMAAAFPRSLELQCKAMGTLNISSCHSMRIGRVRDELGLCCLGGT